MKDYNKLREIIIKANPEIETRNTSVSIPAPFKGLINYKDNIIRLADVLLAFPVMRRLYRLSHHQSIRRGGRNLTLNN